MSRSQRNQNPEAEWINRAMELHLDVFREAPQLDPFRGGQGDVDVCQHSPGIRSGQSGGVPFAVFNSRRGIGINYRLVILSGSGIKVAVSTGLQLSDRNRQSEERMYRYYVLLSRGNLRTNPQRGGEQ